MHRQVTLVRKETPYTSQLAVGSLQVYVKRKTRHPRMVEFKVFIYIYAVFPSKIAHVLHAMRTMISFNDTAAQSSRSKFAANSPNANLFNRLRDSHLCTHSILYLSFLQGLRSDK